MQSSKAASKLIECRWVRQSIELRDLKLATKTHSAYSPDVLLELGAKRFEKFRNEPKYEPHGSNEQRNYNKTNQELPQPVLKPFSKSPGVIVSGITRCGCRFREHDKPPGRKTAVRPRFVSAKRMRLLALLRFRGDSPANVALVLGHLKSLQIANGRAECNLREIESTPLPLVMAGGAR